MNYKNTFYSARVCINDFCSSNIRNFSTELSFAQIFLFRLIISYNHKGKFLVKLLAVYIVVQKISLVTFPSNLEVRITVKEKKKAFPAIKFKYRLFCPMVSNKRIRAAEISAENKTFWKEAQIDLYRDFLEIARCPLGR